MKLGVLTNLVANLSLDEALKYFSGLGIQMVEIGCGGYPGNAHANPSILLNDDAKLQEFKDTIAKYNMEISALSCHGNPIHQINTFSGCPGDCENSKYPNWVTCPWPEDYSKILEWQWNEVLIPYWKDFVAFAKAHGVNKIALELHPGFCVYNTHSLLKLRHAVGPEIGANFDPSHLIWQGMDPVACIRELGKENAIFHFHAKDTRVDKYNTAVNGVLDTRPYADEIHRSWIFRSCGYGNDTLYWKDMISALRMVGYDYAISIEHEDSLMSQNEGLSKAVEFLKGVLTFEDKMSNMWWA